MPARAGLTIVTDDAALARALAGLVITEAKGAIEKRGSFALALAGGSTPKAAYALLAHEATAVDWARVRFFFGDERCVPPHDEQSNYHTAHHALLGPLGIADAQVFRLRGEDAPARAAVSYADVLRRELSATQDGIPVLDLVLLGMGPDGHTASLFPGSNPLTDDAALVRAPYVEAFATYRLTLTPRVLNAGRVVAVATAGDAKADALHAVLDGFPDPTAYPIAILAPRSGDLRWLVDRAAAAKLATG